MENKNIAIITARGGSKRIPRKNIKLFLGHPIIKYTIDAALRSNCFEDVMISTDDREIADIAEKCGAKVPFLRSQKTSNDFANTADVICEVLEKYAQKNIEYEYCCCLYPTAPFVSPEKIQRALDIMKKNNADSVLPVVRFSYPIQRALKIEEGRLMMMYIENLEKRSQDLIPAYHDAGQFYWLKVSSFLRGRQIFTKKTFPMEVPESEVQDIDNEEDWKVAEMKYRFLNGM